jgi:hypothetical protein
MELAVQTILVVDKVVNRWSPVSLLVVEVETLEMLVHQVVEVAVELQQF